MILLSLSCYNHVFGDYWTTSRLGSIYCERQAWPYGTRATLLPLFFTTLLFGVFIFKLSSSSRHLHHASVSHGAKKLSQAKGADTSWVFQQIHQYTLYSANDAYHTTSLTTVPLHQEGNIGVTETENLCEVVSSITVSIENQKPHF